MALNVENIRKVRDVLDGISEKTKSFNMRVFVGKEVPSGTYIGTDFLTTGTLKEGDCQTCACIAGWTASVLLPPETVLEYDYIEKEAERLLGLSYSQSRELFIPSETTPTDPNWDPFSATPKQAAKVLDHLIKTYEETGEGEVVWDAALWPDSEDR